jgi:hypothetical protein
VRAMRRGGLRAKTGKRSEGRANLYITLAFSNKAAKDLIRELPNALDTNLADLLRVAFHGAGANLSRLGGWERICFSRISPNIN